MSGEKIQKQQPRRSTPNNALQHATGKIGGGVGSYTRDLVYGVGHGKPGKSGGLW
jgi:hypothetical protein